MNKKKILLEYLKWIDENNYSSSEWTMLVFIQGNYTLINKNTSHHNLCDKCLDNGKCSELANIDNNYIEFNKPNKIRKTPGRY